MAEPIASNPINKNSINRGLIFLLVLLLFSINSFSEEFGLSVICTGNYNGETNKLSREYTVIKEADFKRWNLLKINYDQHAINPNKKRILMHSQAIAMSATIIQNIIKLLLSSTARTLSYYFVRLLLKAVGL